MSIDSSSRISIPSINSAFDPYVPRVSLLPSLPPLSQIFPSSPARESSPSSVLQHFSGLDLLCSVASGFSTGFSSPAVWDVVGSPFSLSVLTSVVPLVPLFPLVPLVPLAAPDSADDVDIVESADTSAITSINTIKPKRVVKPNPICTTEGHSKSKKNIQKHTCKKCFIDRANELCDTGLTRWDVARLLVREFRNYYCSCCVLDLYASKNFSQVGLGKRCVRGHLKFSRERKCGHGKGFKACNECVDPRAATMFHLCGHHFSSRCNCQFKLQLDLSGQTPAAVALKEAYAVQTLERARQL